MAAYAQILFCFIGVSLVNKVSFPFHAFKGWCDFSLTGHKICFTEKEKKRFLSELS